ncbi:MAG TPA: c-type cytochrome [Oleiagrimonas sp.]|nr:c-type cytochrome [Oleiagrimonas sp.]
MKTKTLFTVLALMMVASGAVPAAPQDAATIARQGNGKGAPPCMACHGADGGGQAAAGFPRLAGLNAAYLERQLDSFAEGSRVDPTMNPVAKALTEDERKALAEYYSKLPIPAVAARGAATPPDDPLGKKLAERGRWIEQVPGCVQCHGPHGVGVGEHFPPLAGQPAAYIAKQLHAWKQGKRRNDPLDLMKHVASALNDKDIQAVSTWFAAQPAKLEGGTR